MKLNRDHYKKANTGNVAASAENSDAEESATQDPGLSHEDIAALPEAKANDDDNDWAADTSAAAVAARMKDLAVSGAVGKLMDKEASAEPDTLNEFADALSKSWSSMSDDEICSLAAKYGVKEDKAITVIAQIIFSEKILIENQIEKRAPLLHKFVKNDKCQKGLIGGIERLVGVTHRQLLPRISLIFKDLYFNDLVEEEVFLSWAEKLSKRYVEKKVAKELKEKAIPFIQWLETAEEESE